MKRKLRLFINSSIVIIIFLATGACHDAFAQYFPEIKGWWISAGGTTGITGNQFLYGGEVSFLYIPSKSIEAYGIVTDYVYDKKLQSGRMMFGPEAAWFFAGIDGGLTFNFRKGKIYRGYSVRPFITLPFFISPVLYYRHTRIYYENNSVPINEFGAILKIAIPLHKI